MLKKCRFSHKTMLKNVGFWRPRKNFVYGADDGFDLVSELCLVLASPFYAFAIAFG